MDVMKVLMMVVELVVARVGVMKVEMMVVLVTVVMTVIMTMWSLDSGEEKVGLSWGREMLWKARAEVQRAWCPLSMPPRVRCGAISAPCSLVLGSLGVSVEPCARGGSGATYGLEKEEPGVLGAPLPAQPQG